MNVAYGPEELQKFLSDATRVSQVGWLLGWLLGLGLGWIGLMDGWMCC